MTPLTYRSQLTVAAALIVPCVLSLWTLIVPQTMTPSTYLLCTTVVLALAGITLTTRRNGQPTASMAPILHETEAGRHGR